MSGFVVSELSNSWEPLDWVTSAPRLIKLSLPAWLELGGLQLIREVLSDFGIVVQIVEFGL